MCVFGQKLVKSVRSFEFGIGCILRDGKSRSLDSCSSLSRYICLQLCDRKASVGLVAPAGALTLQKGKCKFDLFSGELIKVAEIRRKNNEKSQNRDWM